MTIETKYTSRRTAPAAAAALAALLLAGCSTGHIGETWQCPLAEGGSCDSVAAADPAVPDPRASHGTVIAEPLWRVRAAGAPPASAETPRAREAALPARGPGQAPSIRGPGQACAAECDGGFDPLAWLARLFAAQAHEGDTRSSGGPAQAPSATAAQPWDPAAGEEADTPVEPDDALPVDTGASRDAPERNGPATALPAEPGPAPGGPEEDVLRTGEVVARIWIAPFVDADGVYREASHVRVVLEPAGWRLR